MKAAPPFLSVAEASRLVFPRLKPAQARKKLYYWVSLKALPPECAFKVGGTIAIRRTALLAWMGEAEDA